MPKEIRASVFKITWDARSKGMFYVGLAGLRWVLERKSVLVIIV